MHAPGPSFFTSHRAQGWTVLTLISECELSLFFLSSEFGQAPQLSSTVGSPVK